MSLVVCKRCGTHMNIDDGMLSKPGLTFSCPKCGEVINNTVNNITYNNNSNVKEKNNSLVMAIAAVILTFLPPIIGLFLSFLIFIIPPTIISAINIILFISPIIALILGVIAAYKNKGKSKLVTVLSIISLVLNILELFVFLAVLFLKLIIFFQT